MSMNQHMIYHIKGYCTCDEEPTLPINEESLKEIKARCKAAIKGPWYVSQMDHFGGRNWLWIVDDKNWHPLAELTGCGRDTEQYIAHSRMDLPAVIAAYEVLLARCKEVAKVTEKYRGAFFVGNLDVFREIHHQMNPK